MEGGGSTLGGKKGETLTVPDRDHSRKRRLLKGIWGGGGKKRGKDIRKIINEKVLKNLQGV